MALFPCPYHLFYLRSPSGGIPLGLSSTQHGGAQKETETFQIIGQRVVHSQAGTVTAPRQQRATWHAMPSSPFGQERERCLPHLGGRRGCSETPCAGAWGWADGLLAIWHMPAREGGLMLGRGQRGLGIGHQAHTDPQQRGSGRCRCFRSASPPCG